MTNKIKHPLALDSHNSIVSAVVAPKKETYTCLDCSSRMVINRGKVKQPYFSHYADSEITRACNPESVIHKAGKRIISEKIKECINTKASFTLNWHCKKCQHPFQINLTDYVDDVVMEEVVTNRKRPDVCLMKDGKHLIAIEIVYTHHPEEQTLQDFEQEGIKTCIAMVNPDQDLLTEWQDNVINVEWVTSTGKNESNNKLITHPIPKAFPLCSTCYLGFDGVQNTQSKILRLVDTDFDAIVFTLDDNQVGYIPVMDLVDAPGFYRWLFFNDVTKSLTDSIQYLDKTSFNGGFISYDNPVKAFQDIFRNDPTNKKLEKRLDLDTNKLGYIEDEHKYHSRHCLDFYYDYLNEYFHHRDDGFYFLEDQLKKAIDSNNPIMFYSSCPGCNLKMVWNVSDRVNTFSYSPRGSLLLKADRSAVLEVLSSNNKPTNRSSIHLPMFYTQYIDSVADGFHGRYDVQEYCTYCKGRKKRSDKVSKTLDRIEKTIREEMTDNPQHLFRIIGGNSNADFRLNEKYIFDWSKKYLTYVRENNGTYSVILDFKDHKEYKKCLTTVITYRDFCILLKKNFPDLENDPKYSYEEARKVFKPKERVISMYDFMDYGQEHYSFVFSNIRNNLFNFLDLNLIQSR